MNIRAAKPEELSRIGEIYASARAFMREQGNPNQWRTQYPSLELLSADIAEKRLYVCEEEGEL
ncbi:MAG: N-acetyltransferase, partial [Clostridia bacterium]|nr:N-acetyltransferase [Clostridia bacterium]